MRLAVLAAFSALALNAISMPDTLGGITVPSVSPSGTFPLTVEFGFTTLIPPSFVTHAFLGAGDLKREQRFILGTGARQWRIEKQITESERLSLRNFWESRVGPYQPFTFHLPLEDGTTVDVTAQFANEPIVWEHDGAAYSKVQINLIEVYTGSGPTYSVTDRVTRFPSTGMATALTEQTQQLIKLIKIQPLVAGYPAIYLSDQRCTVGGQLYLPRLLRWAGIGQVAVGMPNVSTESDDVTLVFGNADRAMRMLVDDVQLDYAAVTCSAYHVNSGVIIDFWSGIVTPGGWAANTGPEFTLRCSDRASSPFMIIPQRQIDRRCDARFDSAPQCPYSTTGSLDLDNYPNADASTCDHGYTTPNGCAAHKMHVFFRGIVATPQQIRVVDHSTGFLGFGRSIVTSASLISDSAYGHSVPIIVTDIPLPVPAQIIAGRDEDQFYRALGIVGEGPITMQQTGQTFLDGQRNADFPALADVRFIPGDGPAADPAGDPNNAPTDISGRALELYPFGNRPLNFSAGIAACEMLINNEKGIQLTTLDQHSMQVEVLVGWQGRIWTAPGASSIGPLTNPVWLAVNLYLLSLKLFTADAATQEDYIDIAACVASAAICDLQVTRIVELDEGLETQWKYIGFIQDQRPLRDWMQDVLLNCLGFYTFHNGKLAIGVRENAGAQVAYTDGNTIWRSLELAPLGPRFTRLTGTFADREYSYVANTATFQDDDYADELGGGSRALHQTAQINLSGTADISPATRLVVTRGREEIGGVNAAERKAARRVAWKTTALGFDSAPGMVASLTNEDMPAGFGKARIERWVLNDDWSISLNGPTVTESMYDLVQGPKPADVRPGPIPGGGSSGAYHHGCWMPNQVGPLADDPFYDVVDKTFAMTQLGSADNPSVEVDGEQPVSTPAFGIPPRIADVAIVNGGIASDELTQMQVLGATFMANTGAAGLNVDQWAFYWVQVTGRDALTGAERDSILAAAGITDSAQLISLEDFSAAVEAAGLGAIGGGGFLPGGRTYYVALACQKGVQPSIMSVVRKIVAPAGSNTNAIELSGIVWPTPPDGGWDKAVLYASMDFEERLCAQQNIALPLPDSVTFSGFSVTLPATPVRWSTYGPANRNYDRLLLKIKQLCHLGVATGFVTEVLPATGGGPLAGGSIRCMHLASDESQDTDPFEGGIDWNPDRALLASDDWTDRIVSVLTQKSTGQAPLLNFRCTGYDSTSGTFYLDPDPSTVGVGRGDVFVVRFKPIWNTGSLPTQLAELDAAGVGQSWNVDQWLFTWDGITGVTTTPGRAEQIILALGLTDDTRSTIITFAQISAILSKSYSFTDAQMINGQYPLGTSGISGGGSLDADSPPRFGRVLAGPGRGQLTAVVAHDDTSYTFDRVLTDVDETSLIIIEFGPWLQQTNGNKLSISDYLTKGNLNVGIGGLLERGLLVQGALVDVDGQESPDALSPVREFFPFNDVAYGVGGKLTEIGRFEFGRGSDGGPVAVAAGDESAILEVDEDCSLQGWSEVNQGLPVGNSTFDLLKWDGAAYTTILGATVITIPDGNHDKVIFSSAFKLGLDLKLVKGDLLKCVCLTVGGTPPTSPVIRVFAGLPLPRTIDGIQS